MPTSNLEIDYLEQNVAQPEVPYNEALDIMDAAICGQLTINMAVDTDYTLDDTSLVYPQEWQYGILIVAAVVHTGSVNVIVPDGKKMKYVLDNQSGSQPIVLKTTTGTGISVPNGSAYHLYSDGVNVRRIS